MRLWKRKVKYVKYGEATMAADMADLLCKRAAGHFAMEAAKAKAAGEDEAAAAYERARCYFVPQMMEMSLSGPYFPEASVGEKNWAEQ